MFDTIENAIAATIDEIKKNPNRQYDDSLYENMPSYDIMCQLVKAKFSIPNVKLVYLCFSGINIDNLQAEETYQPDIRPARVFNCNEWFISQCTGLPYSE